MEKIKGYRRLSADDLKTAANG